MFFIALRHLTSKKKQTVFMLLGIVLGTTGFVTISGMMLGFQSFIIDQLINNDSHVRVSAREDIITEHSLDSVLFPEAGHVFWFSPPSGRRDNSFILYPQGWFAKLDRDVRVDSYSPQLVTQVLVSRAKISLAGRLIGADPAKQLKVTNIQNYMLQGSFTDISAGGGRIIVGEGLLEKLGARVSEALYISLGSSPPVPMKVVGSFKIGVKSLDETTLFASLGDVQKINRTPSQISDIAVRLVNVEAADSISDSWAEYSQEKVRSWSQANEGTMSVFKTQDIVRFMMTIAILTVAGFGIYNMLSMAITHKRREIAILRSVGFEPRDVSNLFLIQGVLLGLVGGLLGIALGYVACLYMATIKVSSARMIGGGTMMVSFAAMIYVRGFLLAFFASMVASWLPARSAGRLTPIDIIRSEQS